MEKLQLEQINPLERKKKTNSHQHVQSFIEQFGKLNLDICMLCNKMYKDHNECDHKEINTNILNATVVERASI